MLVGTLNISSDEINKCKNGDALIAYAERCVPSIFRHVTEIVHNQRYLLALTVRKLYKNDYNKWHPLCKELLKGVRVTGSVSTIYTCADLLEVCDMKVMKKFLIKECTDDS